MTMVGRRLGAKQDSGYVKDSAVDLFFDFALCDKLQKSTFIILPLAFFLSVVIKYVVGGSKQELVLVFHTAQFF